MDNNQSQSHTEKPIERNVSLTVSEYNYLVELLSDRAINVSRQVYNHTHGINKDVRGANAILSRYQSESNHIDSIMSKLS